MGIFYGENLGILIMFNVIILVVATTWRILEITVLHNYFNSLKKDNDNRSTSYIPLN